MEKQISFGNFIAHIVPGALGLLALSGALDFHFPDWVAKNTFVFGLSFMSLALGLGLFLDSVRYLVIKTLVVIIPPLRRIQKFRKVPSVERIDTYNWIIENSWRHHQFCGNLCLAACVLFLFPLGSAARYLVITAISILAIAAGLMYKTTIDQLNEAFPKITK